eukprot:TRINITY_DN103_c0_g1_i1.p2 TRINITY_DN103_c0_g1~~TRINITY_DN103_c0_g1_i1.p2  ORF type:complete len:184 (-),score=91.03 TRINITY_DN103_c0_g1_i1:57-608(-)
MMKKAALFKDSKTGANKDFANVIIAEKGVTTSLSNTANKYRESAISFQAFCATDLPDWEATAGNMAQSANTVFEAASALCETRNGTVETFDEVLESKKKLSKAGSDADKAAAKATKAKPAEKATLEANANNLKELFDSMSIETDASQRENCKKAILKNLEGLNDFLTVFKSSVEETIGAINSL